MDDTAGRLGITRSPQSPAPPVVDAITAPLTQRPTSAVEMIGQDDVRTRLLLAVHAAAARGEQVGHVLLQGPPGLGKTSLAQLVAHETGGKLIQVISSAVSTAIKLGRELVKIKEGDVFFIDEIHGLSLATEELLYGALEDGVIEIPVGRGEKANVLRVELPRFTLVGATTQAGKLSRPLLDRFQTVLHLTYYSDAELGRIVLGAAQAMHLDPDPDACDDLGRRGRGTPRVALNLLRKARDWSQVMGSGRLDLDAVTAAMTIEDIDGRGLTMADQMVLMALCDVHQGGPVRLENLAVSAGVDLFTVRESIEPFLIRLGFLLRVTKGRVALPAGYTHLGMPVPPILGSW
jgi:Holliday junction DNA helicase RuvB